MTSERGRRVGARGTVALEGRNSQLWSVRIAGRRAFAALARYWDDQLALQQQEADRLKKQVAKDLESFRQTQQVRGAVQPMQRGASEASEAAELSGAHVAA